VELIADPKARVRERKKKLKPRKIITSLEHNDQEIVLTFTGSNEERNNFIESIKEWRLNE
jgi:hypothetical protein